MFYELQYNIHTIFLRCENQWSVTELWDKEKLKDEKKDEEGEERKKGDSAVRNK